MLLKIQNNYITFHEKIVGLHLLLFEFGGEKKLFTRVKIFLFLKNTAKSIFFKNAKLLLLLSINRNYLTQTQWQKIICFQGLTPITTLFIFPKKFVFSILN